MFEAKVSFIHDRSVDFWTLTSGAASSVRDKLNCVYCITDEIFYTDIWSIVDA